MRTTTSGSTDEPLGLNLQRLLNPSVEGLAASKTPGVVRVSVQGSRGPRGHQQGYSAGGVKGSCTSG